MAAANPLDEIFNSEVDESQLSALVGSLENQLASPTSKDTLGAISSAQINSNHIGGHQVVVTTPQTLSQRRAVPNGPPGSAVVSQPALHQNNVTVQMSGPSTNGTSVPVSHPHVLSMNSIVTCSVTTANAGGNVLSSVIPTFTRVASSKPTPAFTIQTRPSQETKSSSGVNVKVDSPVTESPAYTQVLVSVGSTNAGTVSYVTNNIAGLKSGKTINNSALRANTTATNTVTGSAMYNLASVAAEQKPLSIPNNPDSNDHVSTLTVTQPNSLPGNLAAGNPNLVKDAKTVPQSFVVVSGSSITSKTPSSAVRTEPAILGIPQQNPHLPVRSEAKVEMIQSNQPASMQQVVSTHPVSSLTNAILKPSVLTPQSSSVITIGKPVVAPQTMAVVRPPVSTQAALVPQPTAQTIQIVNNVTNPQMRFSGTNLGANSKALLAPRVISGAPVKIAPQHQQVLPIRGPGTGQANLPSNIVLPPGAVLVQGEQGRLVIMQQHPASSQAMGKGPLVRPLAGVGNHPASAVVTWAQSMAHLPPSAVAGSVAAAIRAPSPAMMARPPTAQHRLVHPATIGSPAGTTMVVPSHQPPHTGSAHIIHNISAAGPTFVQSVGARMAGPVTTSSVQMHPPPAVATGQQSQQILDNVKKCKNFLSTLLRLASASNQPPETVRNVKDLIQGLIDGRVEPEKFTEELQKELKSSPQPYLVPFLKKNLPPLRQSLILKKMSIDGVQAPRISAAMTAAISTGGPRPLNPTPIAPLLHQGMSKAMGAARPALPMQTLMLNRPQVPSPRPVLAMQTKSLLNKMSPVSLAAPMNKQIKVHSSPAPKEKRKYEALKDDDDINDVATMGGVNLTEESKNIMGSNSELLGTQLRSCKDKDSDSFLTATPLMNRINAIAHRHGLEDVPSDVATLLCHAAQERLRNIVEKLAVIAEHRLEIYKMDPQYQVTKEVRPQIKFLEELEKLEKIRKEDAEREMLLRVAKSRSKHEDPERQKLKEKAKEMQLAESEKVRQREADLTALAAIGPRKKRKMDDGSPAACSSGNSSMPRSQVSLRPRIKRVNLRDLIFLLEQEKETSKSQLLYKTFLK